MRTETAGPYWRMARVWAQLEGPMEEGPETSPVSFRMSTQHVNGKSSVDFK